MSHPLLEGKYDGMAILENSLEVSRHIARQFHTKVCLHFSGDSRPHKELFTNIPSSYVLNSQKLETI